MASEFLVYLRLGVEHIADFRGYDHILFIVALTAMYPPREWLRVLVLVTAFTLGHTATLALATLDLVHAPTDLVEFLIPLTILGAAVLNALELEWGRRRNIADPGTAPDFEPRGGRVTKYSLALGFGLIHGLGFSTFLRAALGSESSIGVPLLAFNVGVEVGQVLIVASVLFATGLAARIGLSRRAWTWVLSGATGTLALGLAVTRFPL